MTTEQISEARSRPWADIEGVALATEEAWSGDEPRGTTPRASAPLASSLRNLRDRLGAPGWRAVIAALAAAVGAAILLWLRVTATVEVSVERRTPRPDGPA